MECFKVKHKTLSYDSLSKYNIVIWWKIELQFMLIVDIYICMDCILEEFVNSHYYLKIFVFVGYKRPYFDPLGHNGHQSKDQI